MSSDCCIVVLHKGAITEVILVYDLNAMEYLRRNAKFSREFCMGIPNFSREFCMRKPNSLFDGGYQKH